VLPPSWSATTDSRVEALYRGPVGITTLETVLTAEALRISPGWGKPEDVDPQRPRLVRIAKQLFPTDAKIQALE